MQLFGFEYNAAELSLAAILTVTFFVQIYYYMVKYSRIPGYRQKVKKGDSPGVSVVVVIDNNAEYVENVLPRLMEQDYPYFEVVVVDNGSTQDVADRLEHYAHKYENLKTTRINPDPKFKTRRKLALTVGIKAASYPNILFTEPDSFPSSNKWVGLMAKGFSLSDIVIGYCGIAPKPGIANKIIRCSRLILSVRYLSSAIAGKTYRGIAQNIGFTSNLYFENRGYNHLRLNTGDDDLFIQKVANRDNVSIILNPNAMVRQNHYGGLGTWRSERRYLSYSFKFYPAHIRRTIFTELFSRGLFFAAVIAAVAAMIPVLWIAALSALVVRHVIVTYTIYRICRRVGEKGIAGVYFIHDFVSPISELTLAVQRRLKPSKGLWN